MKRLQLFVLVLLNFHSFNHISFIHPISLLMNTFYIQLLCLSLGLLALDTTHSVVKPNTALQLAMAAASTFCRRVDTAIKDRPIPYASATVKERQVEMRGLDSMKYQVSFFCF